MSRKLVVFDFDGTLADSRGAFEESLKEFSLERRLPYDAKKMLIGYVNPDKYDLGWGVPFEEQAALFDALVDYVQVEMVRQRKFIPKLFDRIFETVETLHADFDLSVITARDRPTFEIILDAQGMHPFFPNRRTLCCARERGYAIKPAPDALHCLLKDTGHDPKDVVVVGDTTSDIMMAHNAGAKSIAVTWGLHPREKLETAAPNVFADNVADLPPLIRTLFN